MYSSSNCFLSQETSLQLEVNRMVNSDMDDIGEQMTELRFPLIVENVARESGNNISLSLSNWQIAELNKMEKSILGVECLLYWWSQQSAEYEQGRHCNASWDDVYCWRPVPAGEMVSRSCHETFMQTQPLYAMNAEGNAYRVCLPNGTWLWGNWTNYTECAQSYQEFVRTSEEEDALMVRSQYILFIGSMLSLVCLVPAVIIFHYFRCLRCDRIQILKQLLLALLLRYSLLLVITEPVIFTSSINFRSLDFICKVVLTTYLYATVSSVNWMFVQGVYINGKLSASVHDGAAPFRIYYCIGWVCPLVILAVYGTLMEVNHPIKCWMGYTKMEEIWIVALPIFIVLLVNLLLLVKIVWTLTVSIKTRVLSSDTGHLRRAAMSMIFLVPLLGVSNLLFVYNPGGRFHKFYIIANALLGSTQGVYVAVGYCFLSKDVQLAIGRSFKRFRIRRNAGRHARTANPIHLIGRRQTRDVAQIGGLEPYFCSFCQMHYAAVRLQQNNMQSGPYQFRRDLQSNPLQNCSWDYTNANPYPVLSFSATSSKQFRTANVYTVSDCEVCRRKSFLVQMQHNLRRNSC